MILEALSGKNLLTWNGAFDIPFTTNNLKINLLPALHADVMLMKHTCDESFPFGLKEVATKLWGHDVTAEKQEMQASIKEAGGTSKEYYKASLPTISKYCVQDCLLTFRLYNHYGAELRRQNLEDFYYSAEVMPLYRTVTIPMEAKGIKIDMPALHSAMAEICTDLQTLERGIQEQILPYLATILPQLYSKEYPEWTETGKVPKWRKDGLTAKEAWHKDNPDRVSPFNLLSKHHLKKLFFEKLKETPISKTPTGLPQVDEVFLDAMALKYLWAADLIEYNKLTKLKGTYLERFLEEAEDGIFYPQFNQHRTVSGRYSGDLQQLPRPLEPGQASDLICKHTNRIREFFIPRDGSVLLAADYEQLEPSVFAHISGDPALHNIFNAGLDFYSEVAIRTEGIQGVSSDKKAPNYLGKIAKATRQKAKAYALGVAYGMTGYKLQFELNIPQELAEELVQKYLRAFPKLADWMAKSQDQVRLTGTIKTQSGRVRRMPEAKALLQKYGSRITDSLHLWKTFNTNPVQYAQAKLDRKTVVNCLNNAINFQVQGLAASIVNRASIELAKLGYIPSIQVHDELVYEVPAEGQGDVSEASAVIKDVMENVMKLAVPLRTVPQWGKNYRECK
jgi:DNA polymerase I-like protein with 3'-5' exonuclease and polymerase domains